LGSSIISLICFFVVLNALGLPVVARADDPSAASSPEPRTVARELFRKGFELLNVGDYERALDYFLRSREVMPSGPNERNAAFCLDKLGRYDEALEMYEDLLVSFPDDLDDRDRAILGPAMAALRAKVGNIEVTSNVAGLVLVDSRSRGKLPRSVPIRVLGG